MAEDPNGMERTEEPTQKRLQDARKKGQVARSKELVTVALFLAGVGGIILSGSFMAETLGDVARFGFSFTKERLVNVENLPGLMAHQVVYGFSSLIPFFSFTILSIVAASLVMGGWLFSGEPLMPKLEKLSLIKGLGRMFSKKSMIELLKSILKIVLVGGVMMISVSYFYREILALSLLPVQQAILHSLVILGQAIISLSIALVVISLIDIPFQIWDHKQQLKMTRQEVKDEMKETEGNPELKSRVKELQKEVANRRMLEAVPDSDIIITNPTHYAVALKYDTNKAKAPYVIARGVDHMALKICEIARAHNRTVLQSPALTRAIYHSTKLNQEVATDLYLAVAQLLAYVHRLNEYRAGRNSVYPEKPEEPDIPEYLRK
ncbi:flagellar biosynthesis protein FlhB [Endozoicomonas arenosclerae]|uniref:flagellar biosynthesis protein FlhB n=1 Tax=Endozoicomonas arenosclerae TaxID=1633495 RepID=UPI0007801D5B|nr:flagellar biosynthesis protein FlhB [Endozoicomonas arenosclerae]